MPKRALFHSVKIDNSEFTVVFVRLLKLCMRLVKTNLAQSSVANQSTYFFPPINGRAFKRLTRFPALGADRMSLLRILIGWLPIFRCCDWPD